ncbi:MAG: GGDEF domain-containing protein [Epsilonproteobacteria bacterium]|nr:GGDEF domain-containing protein [Campylobacterota bacterium]
MNTKDLQTVTNDTLKEVRNYEIVTPDFFADTFYNKAMTVDPSIDIEGVNKDSVENVLDKVLRIQKETKDHTSELKDNISLASAAIENKDDAGLGQVKNKIDDLYNRILHLEEQVYVDELTKVQNRKWLFEEVLENNHFKKDGALTFVDVDKFKVINDSYGHVAGDKVLVMIATLTTKLEDSKTVRYGGDEFIVISESADKKYQQKFFDNINSNLAKKDLTYQGHKFKVGISFGSINYKAGDNFHAIIEEVDKMMYEHKKARATAAK